MNKKLILAVCGLILGLAVIAVLSFILRRDPQNPVFEQQSTDLETAASGADQAAPPPPPPPAPSGAANTAGGKLSYDAAVKKYGANRIQFDSSCQARPSNATFKSGTDVLFDNRANQARKILFNGKTYALAAYDYTVVKMTAPYYPATAFIDCDKLQNVATITIQK